MQLGRELTPHPTHYAAVVLTWLGIAIATIGTLSIVYPVRAVGISSRAFAVGLLLAGMTVLLIGWALPARSMAARGASQLDRLLPRYEFVEHHALRIDAAPPVIWRAIHDVTASEIRFFQVLTAIRRLGRDGPEDILNAPGHKSILTVALGGAFMELARDAPRELVIGTVVMHPADARVPSTAEAFRTTSSPGYAKAAMNFRLSPDNRGGTLLETETRVHATDQRTRRRFAAYWRVIYPGSALIRRQWLQAIERRARGHGQAESR